MGIIGNSVDNQGNIEVDTAGTAIYSNGGTVNLQSGDITLKVVVQIMKLRVLY